MTEKKLNLKFIKRGPFSTPNEILELSKKPSVIGREDGHYIIRKEMLMSRLHFAAWQNEKGLVVIRDLDSTNGTFVNKVKIAPSTNVTIKEGDVIQAGICYFRVVS